VCRADESPRFEPRLDARRCRPLGQVVGGGKDGSVLLLRASDMTLLQEIRVYDEINSFAFWNGSAGPLVYVWPSAFPLYAYQVAAGSLTEVATATGALYAYDAADVSKPSLWNSTLDSADAVGTFAKFSPPTVANGKVYLATFSGRLLVYGLKP
jgi:outer membrane protein assembly factor BamB